MTSSARSGKPPRMPDPAPTMKSTLPQASEPFDRRHLAAHALLERGALEAAARSFRELLASRPAHLDSHLGLAQALERLGRAEEAVEALVNASQQLPDEAEIYRRLGHLLAGLNSWEGAELCYAALCRLQPQSPAGHYNRGVALQELGRAAEAIEAFEHAIGLNPGYAAAYLGLGLIYQQQQAFEAALLAFDCATELAPDRMQGRLERARTLVRMGRFADAQAALDNLLALQPGDAEAWNLRGIACKQLGQGEAALAAYDRALAARPDFAEALNNRGNLRLLSRQFGPALADFDRAMALRPGLDWLPGLRLYAALHRFDWRSFEPGLAAIRDGLAQGLRCIQPLALQCLVDDPQLQQQAARIWSASLGPTSHIPLPARPVQPARAGGKIRLAYVSRDFRSHPVSFLMAEVFELHDRERFELIALSYGPAAQDPMQARLRAAFDRFIDAETLTDRQIVELARGLEIDIAIDLSGLTEGARGPLFAQRLAPLQLIYLGYLGTAGAPHYDYLIADPVLVTPETRASYDERLIVLPSYQANDRQRPQPQAGASREQLGLPAQGFVYCCFNNPCKITPTQFDAWAAILQQVPGSVLWVLDEDEAAATHLRGQAQTRGLDPQRLVFARRSSREDYLARLAQADLFLDTLPYNAGTTASDALWMGLPVLTQAGRSFAGRMAASLLQAAGLPELVVQRREDYIARAIDLARRPEVLAELRHKLAGQRATCTLFDTPRFTRSLEQAYLEADRLHRAGQAPTDIRIESPA